MIILHAAPITWAAISGPSTSVPALAAAQNRLDGVDVALVVTTANPGESRELEFPVFGRRILVDNWGRLNLPAPFDRPQLVVFHCPYNHVHAKIAGRLRKAAIPYVICPRGGMTRRAQRYRWWKKRVANLLFFNNMVAHAASLHCLTQGEAEQSRRWNRPIFIVGNGITLPPLPQTDPPAESTPLRLVFIGRLAIEHKGLDMLLEACAIARSELLQHGARVELHGPDWRGAARLLSARIGKLGLNNVVTLSGPVTGEAKTAVLKQARVFIHTSRWEGHPMAVLEALAHGVPCLVTPATNVAEEIAAAAAGWKVRPSPAGIAAGLNEVLTAGRKLLRQAAANARRLAAENYSWDNIAVRSVQAYRNYAAPTRVLYDRVSETKGNEHESHLPAPVLQDTADERRDVLV